MRIKRFNQFVFENLNEGGKIFPDTSKINKEDVDATVKDINDNLLSTLGLELGKTVIRIGSAGHKDVSGDIDLGLIGIDLEKAHSILVDKFPDNEINFIKGLEVLSIAWPIHGSNDLVQVDMMPVYHKEWTEFVYGFPEGSKYKSAHRNWLFMAILASIKNNVKTDDSGEELSYDGYMMNLNKGLYSIKKDYHGKTKILKHGQIIEEKFITANPDKFVKFVFGNEYRPDDVRTFEESWSITKKSDFKWHDKLDVIVENLKKFLDRVELPIPKEIE